MKKSKNEIIIEYSKDMFVEARGVKFLKNGKDQKDGLFFKSKLEGKVIKEKDLILQNKKGHGHYVTIKEDYFRTSYNMTIKQLESLLKYAKKKDAYFTKLDKKNKRTKTFGFYVHFSPDLSIFFKK